MPEGDQRTAVRFFSPRLPSAGTCAHGYSTPVQAKFFGTGADLRHTRRSPAAAIPRFSRTQPEKYFRANVQTADAWSDSVSCGNAESKMKSLAVHGKFYHSNVVRRMINVHLRRDLRVQAPLDRQSRGASRHSWIVRRRLHIFSPAFLALLLPTDRALRAQGDIDFHVHSTGSN